MRTCLSPLTSLLALPLLALMTRAQLSPSSTVCDFLYGTDYTDACCATIISRGVAAPCTDIEYVSNLTECTARHYPSGWAVCVEKQPFLHPASGPLFGYGPSGMIGDEMSLDEIQDVYNVYFSSTPMSEESVAGAKNVV